MNNKDHIEIAPRVTMRGDRSNRTTMKDANAILPFRVSVPEAQLTKYYPWWLDNLADDVTGEGAAMEGTLRGAENVRSLVLDARAMHN